VQSALPRSSALNRGDRSSADECAHVLHDLRRAGYGTHLTNAPQGVALEARRVCVDHEHFRPVGPSTRSFHRDERTFEHAHERGSMSPLTKKRIAVAEPTRVLVRRKRFRRAVATGCGAAVALIVGASVVPRHAHTIAGRALLDIPALVFLVLVVACARSTAVELDDLARWRGGQTAGSAMRMLVTGFGYAIALVGTLSMLSVPVGHLLLGGAIAGVILGIAAQQSLGNVFAGMVLLMARPFAVGNHIRVRSGALGGEFYGTVASMSLTYVSVATEEGMLKVPNSSVLAAAVGPWDRSAHPRQETERSEPPVSADAGREAGVQR
jgi:Mechanosensitive ion channel